MTATRSQNNAPAILGDQFTIYIANTRASGIVGLAVAGYAVFALWPGAPRAALLAWSAMALLLNCLSLYLSIYYRNPARKIYATARNLQITIAFAVLRGLNWGLLALFLPYLGDNSEMMLLILVTGLSASASTWLASVPGAAIGFVAAALSPWCLAYLVNGAHERLGVAALTAALMLALLRSSQMLFKSISDSIHIRQQTRDLVDELATIRQEWLDMSENTEAFAMFDKDHKLLLWNAHYASILEIPPAALKRGANLLDIRKLGAKPLSVAFEDKSWDEWFEEVRYKDDSASHEIIHLLANGRWLRSRVWRTHNNRYAVVHVDVTELKNREEALLQATQNLEQQATEIRNAYRELEDHHRRIELASRELTLARDEALRADRAKTEFLANMSHELRTPLNAIIGFSQMMREEIFGPLGTPNYKDYASNIADSGEHLLTLINEILDLSKVAAGRMELQRGDVAISRLLDGCLQILGSIAANKRIALTVKGDHAGWPLLDADEMKLKQALLNLLSNAIKFTPEGGRVTIATSRAEDGGFVIAVRDTGMGMRAEDIPFVMEPFRRLASAYDGAYQGTGLGLPLARAFTELHGGELTLSSDLRQGTLVTIHLPAELAIDQTKPCLGRQVL